MSTIGKTNFPPGGVDTSDATVTAADMKSGVTAYGAAGTKITGTMTVHSTEQTASAISNSGTKLQFTAPAGYYSGSIQVAYTDADFTATNIRKDINLFGVLGTLIPFSMNGLGFNFDFTIAKTSYSAGSTYNVPVNGNSGFLLAVSYSPSTEVKLDSSANTITELRRSAVNANAFYIPFGNKLEIRNAGVGFDAIYAYYGSTPNVKSTTTFTKSTASTGTLTVTGPGIMLGIDGMTNIGGTISVDGVAFDKAMFGLGNNSVGMGVFIPFKTSISITSLSSTVNVYSLIYS